MGRSSGRSGGGGGRSTGGRAPSYFGSAPSRSSHSSAAPSSTRTAERPRTTAPPPAVQSSHPPAPQPAAPQHAAPAGGGGLLSGLGSTIMQGMAFGGGSAVAHRMVDGIAGPRQVEHVHTGMEGQQGPQVAGQAMQAIDTGDRATNKAVEQQCGDEVMQFQRCLTDNRNDFNSCSFFFDVLAQCQKSVKDNAQWK